MKINQLHDGRSGAALSVRVTPRAKKSMISELMADGIVKIKIAAPAVDDKANKELMRFIAKLLEIKQKNVEIVGGFSSRNKLVAILDISPFEVEEKIKSAVEK